MLEVVTKISLFIALLITTQLAFAQGIIHYSNSNTQYNDLIIINKHFHVVGKKTINGIDYPTYLKLDGNGNIITDTVLNSLKGYFSNIFFLNNNFHISSTFDFFSSYESSDLVVDTNFKFKNMIDIEDGQIDKSVLGSDSNILHIGHNTINNNFTYSFVAVQELSDTTVTSKYTYFTQNSIEMYDIFSLNGNYYYFMNSPDSTNSSHVLQYRLDSNLTVVDSFNLYSSYTNFNTDNSVLGPSSAIILSDSTFMLSSTIAHKVSQNEVETLDHGISIYNLKGDEKSLNFSGNPDTNSITSNTSIVENGSDIFSIATENINGINNSNSYIKLSKIDYQGKIKWSSEFIAKSKLIVNSLYSFGKDSLVVMGESFTGSISKSFILKSDTTPEGLMSSIKSLDLKINDVNIYPNPFTNTLTLETDAKKIDSITIFNNQGQVVKKYINTSKLSDLDDLPPGVYIINIVGPLLNKSSKIIKA